MDDTSTSSLRRERAAITLLVFFGCLLRIVGISGRYALPFSPTLSSVLEIESLLTRGTFWRAWLDSFHSIHGLSLVERSAVMLPLAALCQLLLGPSFELIPIIGCFCGVVSILLAWLVGRQFSDRATALYFAALVGTSPLQITWSRIGGLYISAVPHLLFAIWVSYICGRRASVWCALLAGALSWLSLYNNYQTRVLFLIVPLTVAFTARRHAHTWPRTIALLLAVSLPQVLAFSLLQTKGIVDAFWPKFGAYGTNPDTVKDFAGVVAHGAQALQVQAPRVLRSILYAGRIDPWISSYGWALEYGGVYPAVTLLLGIIGLGVTLKDYRHQLVWLTLLALGFLVPALSGAEPRRLLMFDVAWNFTAARGLAAVLGLKVLASARRETLELSLATLVAALGLWSLLAIFRLSMFTNEEVRAIPFGNGTNGDGTFCNPCYSMSREWQEEAARNQTVVLVNSNRALDLALHPGSLDDFARIAALRSGRPDSIIDFYGVLESDEVGRAGAPNPVALLRSLIHGTRPAKVIWYFKSPTAWEEELVASLERLGADVADIVYPYSSTDVVGGIYSPYVKRLNRRALASPDTSDALLRGLEKQLLGDGTSDESRVRPALVEERSLPSPPIGLTSSTARNGTPPTVASIPRWTALLSNGYVGHDSTSNNAVTECAGIRAIVELGTDGDGSAKQKFVALTELGESIAFGAHGVMESREVFPGLLPIGRGCSVYVGGNWWVVDPLNGGVKSSAPTEWIPSKQWIGVATSSRGELLLASADGQLYILDPQDRTITNHFRIPVWPSLRSGLGDCSVIGAGSEWYFSYDFISSHLTIVDSSGRRIAEFNLADVLDLASPRDISTVAADSAFLGVGVQGARAPRVTTLRLSTG